MRRLFLAALAVSFMTTACGSTVPQSAQLVNDGVSGDGQQTSASQLPGAGGDSNAGGSAITAPGSTGGGGTGGGSTGGGSTGSSGGSTGSSGSVPTTHGTSPASVPTGALPVNPGKTTLAPVQVGILLFPDVAAFASALGGKTGNASGQGDEVKAAIAWANAHGGIAGHPIKPVYFNVNLTSTQTYAVIEQQACTSFTQDNHVVAAVAVAASVDNTFPLCLAKHHVLYLTGAQFLHDQTDYQQVPNMVSPSEVSSTRIAKALMAELFARSYLKSGDSLGMLIEDEPAATRALHQVLEPTLKAHNVRLISYIIPAPSSTADITNSVASISAAELKMAAQNVKNVAFLCGGCLTFFIQSAESQKYYPRYVLNSVDGIQGLAGGGHTQSLKGALGIAWDPLRDIGGYSHPNDFTGNSSRTTCHAVEKRFVTDDTSEFASQTFCGAFLDLNAAGKLTRGALTGDSLMGGFNSLGTSYQAAVNFTTDLTATRHDGAADYRTMHYDGGCDCLLYDSHTLHPFAS